MEEFLDNWDKSGKQVREEAVERDIDFLAFLSALGFGHGDGLEKNAMSTVEDIMRLPIWLSPK